MLTELRACFFSYDISTLLPSHSSSTWTSLMFCLSGRQIQVSFIFLNYTMWTKNVLGDLMSPVNVPFLSVSGVNGFKGKDSQRVTIESTFCWVVKFGFPKARSYFFPFSALHCYNSKLVLHSSQHMIPQSVWNLQCSSILSLNIGPFVTCKLMIWYFRCACSSLTDACFESETSIFAV